MLSLAYGAPGCGKSSQHKSICAILPDALYLCLEYKDKEMLDQAVAQSDGHFQYKIIEKFDNQFLEDPMATLAALEMEINEIIHGNKYKTVVVDGVSDIRSFAMKEWIHNDNLDRKRKNMSPRETIGGENKTAWHDINERVKRILRPLINWANVTRNNVFFTAQLKDNYVNDKKVGKSINIGEWCEYDVDVKMEFLRPSLEKYTIRITKLPDWATDPGEYEINVRKNELIALLSSRGLIK